MDSQNLGQSQEIYTGPPSEPPSQLQSLPKAFPLKYIVILLIVIFVFVSGFGAAYILFFPKTSEKSKSNITSRSPSVTVSSSNVAVNSVSKLTSYDLVYLKGSNVYMYSTKDKKETQITNDGGGGVDAISYRLPRWVGDTNNISYVRCLSSSSPENIPSSCTLILQDMATGAVQNLITVTQKKNEDGKYWGGFMGLYGWDPKGEKVVYLSDSPTPSEFGISDLSLYERKTGQSSLLSSYKMGGGRGGSLEDSSGIEFSPDGTKVFLLSTGFYPGTQYSGDDHGTLIVFDVFTKKLVYEKQKTWSTFASWENSSSILVRQNSYTSEAGGKTPALVRIDTVTGKETPIIAVSKNDYGFWPYGTNEVLFFTISSTPKKGITLNKLNLATKAITPIQDNLYVEKGLGSYVLVRTMSTCGPQEARLVYVCEIDMYNGYIFDQFGIWDGKNIEMLGIPGVEPYSIHEMDVKVNT